MTATPLPYLVYLEADGKKAMFATLEAARLYVATCAVEATIWDNAEVLALFAPETGWEVIPRVAKEFGPVGREAAADSLQAEIRKGLEQ